MQMIVKALLIAPVAALYLTVMPGRSRSDQLVVDMQFVAQEVKRMDFVHFLSMCKFKAVIRLYCIGRIMEIEERSLYKIYC